MKGIVTIIFIVLMLFGISSYVLHFHDKWEYESLPEHTVEIEYVMYTPSGEKTYVYEFEMHGDRFSTYVRSIRGTNKLYVRSHADGNPYWCKDLYQALVYEGTLFIETKEIRILK